MQTDVNRNKVVIKFLQGNEVTQIILGGLTVYPLIAYVRLEPINYWLSPCECQSLPVVEAEQSFVVLYGAAPRSEASSSSV